MRGNFLDRHPIGRAFTLSMFPFNEDCNDKLSALTTVCMPSISNVIPSLLMFASFSGREKVNSSLLENP